MFYSIYKHTKILNIALLNIFVTIFSNFHPSTFSHFMTLPKFSVVAIAYSNFISIPNKHLITFIIKRYLKKKNSTGNISVFESY